MYVLPSITIRLPNVGLMLGQRRRRWANIIPTLRERIVFAGLVQEFDVELEYPGMIISGRLIQNAEPMLV